MTRHATYRSVLIFDGDCPLCSAASSALRRLDDVGTVPWEHESAQRFLEAQFGETPFALAFVDREAERVWMGRAAARELCGRAGMPALVRDVVGDNYETIADAVRRVTGVAAEPDPYHDVVPLADEAVSRFDALAANAERTHRPDVDPTRDRRTSDGGTDDGGTDDGHGGRIADDAPDASRRRRR